MVAVTGNPTTTSSPPLNPPTGGSHAFDAAVANAKPPAAAAPVCTPQDPSGGKSASKTGSKSGDKSGGKAGSSSGSSGKSGSIKSGSIKSGSIKSGSTKSGSTKSASTKSASTDSGSSKSDYANVINGLRDGDQFTVSIAAGGQIALPLEEFDIPGAVGPQAQYGYDAVVSQVGSGKDAKYNVTFDKNLMAGAVEQPKAPLDPQFEENLVSAGTVTMTFNSKADLSRGLNTLRQTVEAQSLRDLGTVENPKVAIAKPSVPHADVAALEHDGSNVKSDAGSFFGGLLHGAKDLAAGHPGKALKDAEGAGGAAVNGIRDGINTGIDLGKAEFDTAKNEVVNSFWDNATNAGNFVRNPLDQWPTGPAFGVPLEPGPGQLINAGADYLANKVAPSAADTQFLKDHITGYAVTGGLQLRASVKLSAGLPGIKEVAQAIGQPRLADTAQVTVAETKPQGKELGTVSITFANKANLDVKTIAQLKLAGGGYKGALSELLDPNVGSATGSLTLTYNLTKEQSEKLTSTGHSLSITDLVPLGRLGHPDKVTAKFDVQGAVPLVDQNGRVAVGSASHETLGDLSLTKTFTDPGQALATLKSFPDDPVGAVKSLVRGTDVQATLYDQHGVTEQTEIGGGVDGVLDGKVYLQQQETTEHRLAYYDSQSQHDSQSQPAPRQTPAPPPYTPAPHHAPAPPPRPPAARHEQQLVVMPDAGLNIRGRPNTGAGRLGAFSGGTFVHTTGQRAVDAQGNQWIRVSGPDSNRNTVTGWVEAKYVTPHAQGGENADGRVDPSLRGYIPITVRPGDTLDGIAARYGRDPGQVVAVNQGHIVDPDLIFPGDTVYLPGGPAA